MVSRLCVLVRDMPPLLRDIVAATIASQSDMELIADGGNSDPRDHTSDPDVVIVAMPAIGESQAATRWLARWPRARIVVIETGGRRSVIYELRPHATPLGEMSPEQLVEVIRTRAGSGLAIGSDSPEHE